MDLVSILLHPVTLAILKILVIFMGFVMMLATVLTLMERKWMSAVQDRIGPNRANAGRFTLHGALHLAADGLKSIFKEDTIPDNADRFIFTIAPYFLFFSVVLVWSIIPFAAPVGGFTFQITDVNIGILLIFAVTGMGVYGAVLAGWSSNNKFAMLGATRTSAQMISYEIFLGLSLVGVFMVYGTVRIGELVALQGNYWFGDVIPMWGVFTQPVAFFLFYTAMLAELKRQPFDAPEGESEIVAGYFLEYSGMRWSAFMLGEYIGIVGAAALVVTLFFGGYQVPWIHSTAEFTGFGIFGWQLALPVWLVTLLQIGAFCTKVVIFCWLTIILRWTIPRFRFDQIMELGWKRLLPISLANILVTALVLLAYDAWMA